MKRVLITGKNSFIGTSFENWLAQWPDEYVVDTLDMIDCDWRSRDFSSYDTVFHVAGIAHVKETPSNRDLYYQVNRDLAIETAKKAKDEGVKQFVFLSTMSVYGLLTGEITKDTIPNPKSNYGKSKLHAEELIETLSDADYYIAILRPPMVYGEGCRGNYAKLCKYAKKTPVFPKYENKRSMISIENLCKYIKNIIDCTKDGYFYPQDESYICTSDMVRRIAGENGRKIIFTRLFNPLIRIVRIRTIKKVFGNLTYKGME